MQLNLREGKPGQVTRLKRIAGLRKSTKLEKENTHGRVQSDHFLWNLNHCCLAF